MRPSDIISVSACNRCGVVKSVRRLTAHYEYICDHCARTVLRMTINEFVRDYVAWSKGVVSPHDARMTIERRRKIYTKETPHDDEKGSTGST